MTQVTRRELFPGVWLRTVHTDKFKSSYLSLTMLVPLERERAAANALLFPVLRRGTREHPDMESLSAALDELYGGAIEPIVRKKGETQCVGFVASFLDDAYAPGGEPILEPAAGLLGELLLRPRTSGRHFLRRGICVQGNGPIWWTASGARSTTSAPTPPCAWDS